MLASICATVPMRTHGYAHAGRVRKAFFPQSNKTAGSFYFLASRRSDRLDLLVERNPASQPAVTALQPIGRSGRPPRKNERGNGTNPVS